MNFGQKRTIITRDVNVFEAHFSMKNDGIEDLEICGQHKEKHKR